MLVDQYGRPVVRCRCGNPLTRPTFVPTASCYGCPARYRPPEDVCNWWSRHTSFFSRTTPRTTTPTRTTTSSSSASRAGGPTSSATCPTRTRPGSRRIRVFPGCRSRPSPRPLHHDDAAHDRAEHRGPAVLPPRSQLEFERCVQGGYLGTDSNGNTTPAPTTPTERRRARPTPRRAPAHRRDGPAARVRPDRPATAMPRELDTLTERRLVVELQLEDRLPAAACATPRATFTLPGGSS